MRAVESFSMRARNPDLEGACCQRGAPGRRSTADPADDRMNIRLPTRVAVRIRIEHPSMELNMKAFSAGLALMLGIFSAQSAAAQQPDTTRAEGTVAEVEAIITRSGIVTALDSLAAASAPELERALDQLTSTLNVLADRIANDPELRRSAFRAAQGMVDVSQVIVAEQSLAIQDALKSAAERIAAATEARTPAVEPRAVEPRR
jgi:hypothetical protein